MAEEYNIYCDESCHLQNDKMKSMTLGAVMCKKEYYQTIIQRIKEIKSSYHIPLHQEMKWVKISPTNVRFYENIIDFFFDSNYLSFRGIVIPDKSKLNHEYFRQTHDDWYYKMYFLLLDRLFTSECKYNVYIDIKDTLGYAKLRKLKDFLHNSNYDFDKCMISKIQEIRSYETSIIQITDLIIGALSYLHRESNTSNAKLKIINKIKIRSRKNLMTSTFQGERKFNLLIWESMNV